MSENQFRDEQEMVDDPNIPTPKCASCGVPWVDHMGIMGVCLNNRALKEDLKDSLEAHDEMRLEIAQLTKERDEAIVERDEARHSSRKWHLYIDRKQPKETP